MRAISTYCNTALKTKWKLPKYQVKNQINGYVFLRRKHTTICPTLSAKPSTWSLLRSSWDSAIHWCWALLPNRLNQASHYLWQQCLFWCMWTGWNIFLSLYCSSETEAILVGLEEVAGVQQWQWRILHLSLPTRKQYLLLMRQWESSHAWLVVRNDSKWLTEYLSLWSHQACYVSVF